MALRKAGILKGYYMQVMMFAGINVMMTASLNLVNGFTGQFCIGHAGFMSLGAYGSAVITTMVFAGKSIPDIAEVPVFILGLICGGIVAAIVGCLIGIPSLKLKGDYLAIVTLAFGEIVRALLRYQFLDKKRLEGKPYRVYMIAAAHKFLRIYYARVMQALS